jgi:hypothetical protein
MLTSDVWSGLGGSVLAMRRPKHDFALGLDCELGHSGRRVTRVVDWVPRGKDGKVRRSFGFALAFG